MMILNADMVKNKADYMVFNSVAKVGAPTMDGKNFDPFYEDNGSYQGYKPMSLDENGEPLGLSEFDFSQLGIQVEIAPEVKEKVSAGTQLTSLLPVNIFETEKLAKNTKELN